jgi:hypothetical protein
MRLAEPRRRRTASLALAATACALVAAGCTTHQVAQLTGHDLATARAFKEFTVYWAGMSVDGVNLTAADNLADFNSSVGFALYYGDCEGRGTFHTAGCTLPLKITTVRYSPHSDASFGAQRWIRTKQGVPAVVYHGGQDIEVYTDRMDIDIVADSPRRALDALNALYPFNRDVTSSFPAFPQPYFEPDVSQQQLVQEGASGSTGATGATSDIAPPPQVQPTAAPRS